MSNILTIYNLSVTFETKDSVLQSHIRKFLERYYTVNQAAYSAKGSAKETLYAGKLKNKGIWQLHSTQFVHLYQHLKEINYPITVDEKIDLRDYNVVNTNFKVRDNWVLREDQVPVYEFLTTEPSKSKLVPLQTGSGKTVLAMVSIAKLKKRLGIVILSRFAEKWIKDIAQIHEAKTTDVMFVQGSRSLAGLIQMAKDEELKHDYFVFSAETIQSYITNYEEDPESAIEQYGCSPMELFPLLGIGIMLNDETHMSFHLIFKTIIYMNVEYQIGLSATLVSDDHIVRRMHKVVYPDNCVYKGAVLIKYMDMYPIAYNIRHDNMKFIRTNNYGSTNYSHGAFEQSVLKQKHLTDAYIKLIKVTVEDYFDQDYQEKDKLVIFVSLVRTATTLRNIFKKYYPGMNVVRYTQEDSYEDMLKGDIIVTTPLSLGTGIDVPNLRVVINTVSVSSTPINIQIAGRLRKLKDRDVKYCYLYCENIAKQKQYHRKRVEIFSERASSINYRRSRIDM